MYRIVVRDAQAVDDVNALKQELLDREFAQNLEWGDDELVGDWMSTQPQWYEVRMVQQRFHVRVLVELSND